VENAKIKKQENRNNAKSYHKKLNFFYDKLNSISQKMPRSNILQETSQDDDVQNYSSMFCYENLKEKGTHYFSMFIELCGIYIVWIVLHYTCSHLYVSWCTPMTIVGFLLSPFIVPAPHCQAFRWVIVNGSNTITLMWCALGSWLAKKIVL